MPARTSAAAGAAHLLHAKFAEHRSEQGVVATLALTRAASFRRMATMDDHGNGQAIVPQAKDHRLAIGFAFDSPE